MAHEEFLIRLQTALLENDAVEAEYLINLAENQYVIKEHLWEIIPSISYYISSELEIEEDVRLMQCVDLLDLVCSKCTSEDIVLALHKEIGECDDDVKFGYLLKQLYKALIGEDELRMKYHVFAFGAIKSYLKKLPIPDNLNLENKERFLMDTDRDVYRISDIYTKINDFYNEELIKKFHKSQMLIKYMLHLFGKPLVYLDLISMRGTKSNGRLISEKLIHKVAQICDVFKFITGKKFQCSFEDESEMDRLSLLNFYYLIIYECIGGNLIPKVYESTYLFQNSIGLIAEGFQYEHQFVIDKSLLLASKLLEMNKYNQLSHLILEDSVHQEFCTGISKIIIYCPLKSDRQRALNVFKMYLLNFNMNGRYLIISNMLQLCNHSGLSGFMTTLYKDMLVEELKNDTLDCHFTGKKFQKLLFKFCNLPKKEESDLLELADLIVPTLNLIRYLAIRDQNNATGIWNYVHELSEKYFEPLTKGLVMSKAHYNLKINELEQEAAKGDERKKKGSKVMVSIPGGSLPEMTYAQQMSVMYTSLTAFDVIGSLLNRVVELVEFSCVVKVSRKCSTRQDNVQDDAKYEEDIRNKILEAALPFVKDYGWSKEALSAGAESVGYPGITHGMFARGGGDLVLYFQQSSNKKLVEFLKKKRENLEGKQIPPVEFVETACKERLQMVVPYISKWPQAIAIMSLPPNVPTSLATLLTLVDDICYHAGDRSVDIQWYGRRVALAGVYKASELYLLQDNSPEHKETWKFLNRRLTEAVQLQDMLNKSDFMGQGAKDTISAAFTTARNILGLNKAT